MISYKSYDEIELIRQSSLLVAKTHAELARHIQPGIETALLESVAEEFIRGHGAAPAFKGYKNYPCTLCVSINDEVVHGIPGKRILQDGDIVSVDCGVLMNGFYGDSAYTFPVGEVNHNTLKLLEITKNALYKGIELAVDGKRVGDISFTIQQYVESFGFSVVRDLVGHGIGKQLHEKPEIPNFGKRGTGAKLKEGMVIAIEPMTCAGNYAVQSADDGWTVKTADGSVSAHFEHTVAIGKEKADILSSFSYIEECLREKELV